MTQSLSRTRVFTSIEEDAPHKMMLLIALTLKMLASLPPTLAKQLQHQYNLTRWRNFRLTGKHVDRLTSKYALHHLLC